MTRPVVLDWSGANGAPKATVGPLTPCQHCGQPALLRHPVSRIPTHKICAEKALAEQPDPPRKDQLR